MEARKSDAIDPLYYQAPTMQLWQGRYDGDELTVRRWHQHLRPMDLMTPTATPADTRSVVLLGFACDEGVKRNQGRIGAADGPDAIRKALCNLPVHPPYVAVYDAGDIHCFNGELETAQAQLALAVAKILAFGAFPLLLGGGHEITYGHYCGIRAFLKSRNEERLGVINFDAHFDNREVTASGPTSGTGFWQIAQDCRKNGTNFRYLALGIQKISNTPHLFETAKRTQTEYVPAEHFDGHVLTPPDSLVDHFSKTSERLYITIDMDVFAAAYAPGVSAPAYNGIRPNTLFFDCVEKAISTGKLLSLDIAELNPKMDIDGRTAKLAATIIFHVVGYLSEERH